MNPIRSSVSSNYFALPIGRDRINDHPIYAVYYMDVEGQSVPTLRPIGTVTFDIRPPSYVGISAYINATWTPNLKVKFDDDIIAELVDNVTAYFTTTISKEFADVEVYSLNSFTTNGTATPRTIPRANTSSTYSGSNFWNSIHVPEFSETRDARIITDMKPMTSTTVDTNKDSVYRGISNTTSTMLIKMV